MSRGYMPVPRRESNFSWYFCRGTFNLVLHTKAKRSSAVEYTQVCFCAFMSSISLRASSLGGGGGGLGGRGGNGIRLQSLRSAILMMHPCSTVPSGWLCINDLMNYLVISQVKLFYFGFCYVCIVRESKARLPGSGPCNRNLPFQRARGILQIVGEGTKFSNQASRFLLNGKRPALVTLCTIISRVFPL